jgi:hypothetical protein
VRLLAALLLALLLTLAPACAAPERGDNGENPAPEPKEEPADRGDGSPGETAGTTAEETGGTSGEEPVEETTQAGSPESESPEGASRFTAAAEASGGEPGAADTIGVARFGDHGGYERAVIKFESGGGPAAGVPEWTLSSPAAEGYARIELPGIESTAVSGGSFGGEIMDDLYVVRSPESGFFVDVFATGPFQYRVLELKDPGRLAIDFRQASGPLDPLPERTARTVLFEPREGESVSSPLTISGYSRNFEGSNTITLTGPDGAVIAEQTVQANDWSDTWGYFETTLEFSPFSGEAILSAGSQSPRDGSFEGAEVPVVYGG